MDNGDWAEAFGYRWELLLGVARSVQVSEAKDPDTLQPHVVIWVRVGEDEQQHGIALPPDGADALAIELTRWAQRAREKDFDAGGS